MKQHKAIEATLERARSYGAIARDALAIFPDRPEKVGHGAGHRFLRAAHALKIFGHSGVLRRRPLAA